MHGVACGCGHCGHDYAAATVDGAFDEVPREHRKPQNDNSTSRRDQGIPERLREPLIQIRAKHVCAIVTLGLAMLSWRFIESPINRRRDLAVAAVFRRTKLEPAEA